MKRNATSQPDKMRIAAEFRFANPEANWDQIAAHVGTSTVSLWRWRKLEQWEIICREVASEHIGDLAPDAIAALRRAWKKGNPAGALDVLRALALLRSAELNVTHSMEPDLDAELSRLFGEIRADSPST
jgi:hypothetical protein